LKDALPAVYFLLFFHNNLMCICWDYYAQA
ncbi:MAG: hypothetical protein ACI88H_002090, partial [Cocleimonas sp.]